MDNASPRRVGRPRSRTPASRPPPLLGRRATGHDSVGERSGGLIEWKRAKGNRRRGEDRTPDPGLVSGGVCVFTRLCKSPAVSMTASTCGRTRAHISTRLHPSPSRSPDQTPDRSFWKPRGPGPKISGARLSVDSHPLVRRPPCEPGRAQVGSSGRGTCEGGGACGVANACEAGQPR